MELRAPFVAAMVTGASMNAQAGDPGWPLFRGPAGTGIAEHAQPPTEIGPKSNVRWKVPVPAGFSSPVVAGHLIVVTGFENGKLYTLAYSRSDGKEAWRAEAPAKAIEAYHKTEGSPAASTPATDGERLVSYFGSCGLFCYDLAGKELWRYEMPTAQTANDFGSGTSPILADGKVYLVRDLATGSKVFASDARTGSLAWEKSRDGFPTGYGSPAVWDARGGKELVVPGGFRMVGYDPKTGAERWSVSGLSAIGCTTPTVAEDGTLVYAAWSPGGSSDRPALSFDDILKQGDANGDGVVEEVESEKTILKGFFTNSDTNKDGRFTRDERDAMLNFLKRGKNQAVAVKPGGRGDLTETNVLWRVTKGLPYVSSPLSYRGQVYLISVRGRVSVYDIKTDKKFIYENVGLSGCYASPVAADGSLYLFGLDGTAVVLKAGDSPEVVARAKFGERIAATPAVAGNDEYVSKYKYINLYEH